MKPKHIILNIVDIQMDIITVKTQTVNNDITNNLSKTTLHLIMNMYQILKRLLF